MTTLTVPFTPDEVLKALDTARFYLVKNPPTPEVRACIDTLIREAIGERDSAEGAEANPSPAPAPTIAETPDEAGALCLVFNRAISDFGGNPRDPDGEDIQVGLAAVIAAGWVSPDRHAADLRTARADALRDWVNGPLADSVAHGQERGEPWVSWLVGIIKQGRERADREQAGL